MEKVHMQFTEVIKAADWLGKSADVARLEHLKDRSEERKFYVTVWGHYSAGKSKLINSIFQRDILPVQSRETTAVLTYVQYGERERCVFVYENGERKEHDLSAVKDIFQYACDSEELERIHYINVYINSEVLKSGLILVDTPGVNTIIQKHQNLAVSAIEQSGRILYVLGNAPSDVDRQFIKRISDCGVRISVVRTKCDRFNEKEEDPEASLKKEKEEIQGFIGSQIEFIPVSNEKESKWNANIEKVKKLLYGMADTIDFEMQEACRKRLSVFASQYISELCQEEAHLQEIVDGDTEKIKNKIGEYESNLKTLESIAHGTEKKIEKRISRSKREMEEEIDEFLSKRIRRFEQALSDLAFSRELSSDAKKIYSAHMVTTIEQIQMILNEYFEHIIKEESQSILKDISDDTINIPVPTYAEVQQENACILEMYRENLADIKEKIKKMDRMRQENDQALHEAENGFDEEEYDKALKLLKEKLAEIPPEETMRLSDDQKIQPSFVMKKIGQLLEVAMMLLPNNPLVKTTIGVGWAKKALGPHEIPVEMTKPDFIDPNMMNKKKGSLLDKLSISYWLEKIGKGFDSEPVMEVDQEKEKARNQLINQIKEKQLKLTNEKIKGQKEIGLLKDKDAELAFRLREEKEREKKIEQELKMQEENLARKAQADALDKYKYEYKNYYADSITTLSQIMQKQYFDTANQNIAMYIASQNSKVMDEIQNKKNQMQELILLKEKGNQEIKQRMEECKEMKAELEKICL